MKLNLKNFLRNFLFNALLLSIIPTTTFACETLIGGDCYDNFGVIDYNDVGDPSVSDSDSARIYYDRVDDKLKCSENGGAFVDCISPLGSQVDISSETNLAVTSPVVLTNDTLSVTNGNLTATSPIAVSATRQVLGGAAVLSIVANSITDSHTSFTYTLAGNPALSANRCYFASTGIICEGSTADSFEGLLTWPITTSDKTITFPNATGTVCISTNNCGYTPSGTDIWVDNSGDSMSGQLRMYDGSESSPAITFESDSNQSGLFLGSGELWIAKDAIKVWGLRPSSAQIITSGPVPSVAEGCGADASIVGNDSRGTVTVGGDSSSCCTITFADRWANSPVCPAISTDDKETPYVSSVGVTQITYCLTNSGNLDGDRIYYSCAEGRNL